jgi:hypothetical protein
MVAAFLALRDPGGGGGDAAGYRDGPGGRTELTASDEAGEKRGRAARPVDEPPAPKPAEAPAAPAAKANDPVRAAEPGLLVAPKPVEPAPGPSRKDPAKQEKVRRAREEFRAQMVRKEWLPFLDLSYGVDGARIDSLWSQPDLRTAVANPEDLRESEGLQFVAVFELRLQGDAPEAPPRGRVSVQIVKRLQKSLDGKNEYSMAFERAGLRVKVADDKALLDATFREQTSVFADVVKDATVEPRKVNAGPADRFASVTGTDRRTSARERMDFYVWRTPNLTWTAGIRYEGACAEKAEVFAQKVLDLLRATKELKAPD